MGDTPDVLKRIVTKKWEEVEHKKSLKSISEMERISEETSYDRRGFVDAIRRCNRLGSIGVIAEIKKASPSKGIIRKHLDPGQIARSYESGGATCLSVLTDEFFFQGSDQNLSKAREASNIPVLRKDFILAPYQIYEAAAIGSDCVLLIASILSEDELKQLNQLALSIGLDTLIEVHNLVELTTVKSLNPPLIGINNRDLQTFDVSLNVTLDLLDSIPEETLVISESGIKNRENIMRLTEAGVDGFLVGEALMRHNDPGRKLKELFSQ